MNLAYYLGWEVAEKCGSVLICLRSAGFSPLQRINAMHAEAA